MHTSGIAKTSERTFSMKLLYVEGLLLSALFSSHFIAHWNLSILYLITLKVFDLLNSMDFLVFSGDILKSGAQA